MTPLFVALLSVLAGDPPVSALPASPPVTQSTSLPGVEVQGKGPKEVNKIDRRAFVVPDDPKSASADIFELLKGLPAVSVGLDNRILLLGSPYVQKLIDGQNADPARLRALRGGDIDRIEIITNPSVEFSPEGVGGIINIILKRTRRGDGFSGAVTAWADDLGGYDADVAPRYVFGPWTFSGSFSFNETSGRRAKTNLRSTEAAPGEPATTDSEVTTGRSKGNTFYSNIEVDFRPNDRITLKESLFYNQNSAFGKESTKYTPLTIGAFGPYTAISDDKGNLDAEGIWFSAEKVGITSGDKLELDASASQNHQTADSLQRLQYEANEAEGVFDVGNKNDHTFYNLSLTYDRPGKGDRDLSLGTGWTRVREALDRNLDNLTDVADIGDSYVDDALGVRDIAFAYVTYQTPLIGRWIVKPGLRFEAVDFRISGPLFAPASTHSLDWYPSVHIDRRFGDRWEFKLSYSKRINRPDVWQLDPTQIVVSPTQVTAGNADLRNQTTNAFESSLDYRAGELRSSLTLYDRETFGLWDTINSVTRTGLNLAAPVNAGHKADRGAEMSAKWPISRRFRLDASVDLFDSHIPVETGLATTVADYFSYTGKATLEWDLPGREGKPGDMVQVQMQYEGPTRSLESVRGSVLTPSLSWAHPLTDRVSSVLTVGELFGAQHVSTTVSAPTLQEAWTRRIVGPTVQLRLTWRFGKLR